MAKNVLVLNDEENSLGDLVSGLQAAGYTAYSTTNADDCIDKFDEVAPKALYFSLKTIGVLDSLQVIRMDPEGATVPIIFFGTGKETIKNEKTAKARGGDGFFKLPLDVGKVVQQCKKAIGPGDPNAPLPDAGGEPEPEPEPEPTPEPTPEPAPEPEVAQEEKKPEETLETAADELLGQIQEAEAAAAEAPADDAPAAPQEATTEPEPTAKPLAATLPTVEPSQTEETIAAEAAPTEASSPTDDAEPTGAPAETPAEAPTPAPAETPAEAPTPAPAETPAEAPTPAPAETPAEAPTPVPAETPTEAPTPAPAAEPPAESESASEPATTPSAAEPEAVLGGANPAELQAANERAGALEAELAQVKTQLAEQVQMAEQLQSSLDTSTATQAQLSSELESQNATSMRQSATIEKLESDAKSAREDFETKHHHLEAQWAERQMATEATSEKNHEEIQELRTKLRETQARLDDQTDRGRSEEEDRRKLEQEHARLSEREKRMVEDNERLKLEREQANARADKLAEELKGSMTEVRSQLEKELLRRSDEQERWRSSVDDRAKLEDQVRDQEQQLLRRENEESTRRLEEQQERVRVEEEIRRQAEQNIRRQLDQEQRYQDNQIRRQHDALDPNLEPPLRENMQSVYGEPAPAQTPMPLQPGLHGTHPATQVIPPAQTQPVASTGPGTLSSFDAGHGVIQGPNEMANLFTSIWRKQVNGRVDFQRQDVHKVVYFERGSPVETFSNQNFDRIEDYLHREGKITRAQYQSLRLRKIQGTRRVGAILVAEGQLKPEELFEAVRGHLKEVCTSLFEWQQGTFTYREEEIEEDQRIRLREDARCLILEGIRRKYLLPRLMTVVGPPSTLLKPRLEAQLDLDMLRLESRERQAVRMLDGTRNVEDIVFSTGMEPLAVYQVLAGLLTLDLVQVLVRGNEGYSLDGSSSADVLDRRRLEDKVEQTRHADYFTILGISKQATPYEVTQAHKKQLQEYAQNGFSEPVRTQYKRELQEIERVLDDAFEVLRDDSLRLAYARNLPHH